METFSPIHNCRQGIELYSSLLTGAPIANWRQREKDTKKGEQSLLSFLFSG